MRTISENITTSYIDDYDVVVVGGGVAGVAAAMIDDFSALSVEALQAELSRRGVVLFIDNL